MPPADPWPWIIKLALSTKKILPSRTNHMRFLKYIMDPDKNIRKKTLTLIKTNTLTLQHSWWNYNSRHYTVLLFEYQFEYLISQWSILCKTGYSTAVVIMWVMKRLMAMWATLFLPVVSQDITILTSSNLQEITGQK